MAWKPNVLVVSALTLQLAVPSSLLKAQQSSFQSAIADSANIDDTYHLPYINQVAQENKLGPAFFRPTLSDLLIQKAEERYRRGRQFLLSADFLGARVEFDAAIDLMLQASDNPTNRQIFESKFEEMVESIHHFDLSGMGAAQAETTPRFDKAPLEDIVQMTFPVDQRIKDKVKTELANTSSALPLVMNDTVLGYINFFSGRGRRTMEAGLERAGKYRPMISRILAEEGVPQELIHLAQAESGFLPRAVSYAAAMGMWQFVKFRGNQYGLLQTPNSDDRLDPEKATRAAARHLRDLYQEFGDWYLAIAAYNCGPGNVSKAVERTGYADFWELRARHALPAETTNYVPIILAMTIMAKNAPEYGLDRLNPESPLEYDTVAVTAPTHLALIGDITDTPVTQLQQMNPALLRSVAPSGYALHVPKGVGLQVASTLDTVPADRRASWRMHRVEQGEDLATVARRFNAPVATILTANSMARDTVPSAGDRLLIPASYREDSYGLKKAVPQHGKKAAVVTARSKRRGAVTTVASSRKRAPKTPVATLAKKSGHKTAGTLAQVHRKPSNNR